MSPNWAWTQKQLPVHGCLLLLLQKCELKAAKLLLRFKSCVRNWDRNIDTRVFFLGFLFTNPTGWHFGQHVATRMKTAAIHCCWSGCGSGSYARHSLVVKLSSLSLRAVGYVILLCGCVQLVGAARIFADFVASAFSFVLIVSVCLCDSLTEDGFNTVMRHKLREAKRRFLCEVVTVTNERGETNKLWFEQKKASSSKYLPMRLQMRLIRWFRFNCQYFRHLLRK